jgi:hypothetical protein
MVDIVPVPAIELAVHACRGPPVGLPQVYLVTAVSALFYTSGNRAPTAILRKLWREWSDGSGPSRRTIGRDL